MWTLLLKKLYKIRHKFIYLTVCYTLNQCHSIYLNFHISRRLNHIKILCYTRTSILKCLLPRIITTATAAGCAGLQDRDCHYQFIISVTVLFLLPLPLKSVWPVGTFTNEICSYQRFIT